MKGRTLIELVDEKTGEREVIAENNMIGSAVQELFNCSTKHGGTNEVLKHLTPLYAKMFGGILLFEEPIDETEKTVPAGNKITGAGSYRYSNQSSAVNGDYNLQESEVTDTYVKHVWDFKTSQANGRISSICLCDSVYTKHFLYGADYLKNFPSTSPSNIQSDSRVSEDYTLPAWGWGDEAFIYASNGNSESFGNGGGTYSHVAPHYVYFEDDFSGYVTMELENPTTLVFKKWSKTREISLFGRSDLKGYEKKAVRMGNGIEPIVTETKTFTVPNGMVGNHPGFWFDNISKKLYIAYGGDSITANNETVTFLTFDFNGSTLASVTMTNGTFTNKTGKTIYFGGANSNASHSTFGSLKTYFAVVNGYIYTTEYATSGNAVYKINVSDNTDITKIEKGGLTGFPDGFLFSSNGCLYFFDSYSSNFRAGVIDTVKNTVASCRMESVRVTSTSNPIFIPTKTDSPYFLTHYFSPSEYSYPTFPFILRNYLSTINNLPSPVTKTSDKTMKVTYILEQEE